MKLEVTNEIQPAEMLTYEARIVVSFSIHYQWKADYKQSNRKRKASITVWNNVIEYLIAEINYIG